MFIKIYGQLMGKRIIYSWSVNDEMENLLLQYLQNECGNSYMHRLLKMRKDIQLSQQEFMDF